MAENYGNTLTQFAISNNPTLMSQKRPGLAGLIGDMISKGKDDPSKQALAQYAPTTLNNPNPMDIIGGALGKAAMPQAKSRFSLAPELQAPDVDLSNLGNFGDVNSTAHASEMGQKADAGKPGFWDSKGGNILGSLLGIIGLGTLGAGIGAISGGGRGALRGASYGMGFGALQDIALRKQSMEAPSNIAKNELEMAKIEQSGIPTDAKMFSMYQQMPPDQQAAYKDYKMASNPIGYEGLDLRRQGMALQKETQNLRKEEEKRRVAEEDRRISEAKQKQIERYSTATKPITETLDLYKTFNDQVGFDIRSYDRATNTAEMKDDKGNITRQDVNMPGFSNPTTGSRVSFYDMSGKANQITGAMQAIINKEIKDTSGATVTNQEMERLKADFQAGAFRTDSDKLGALKRYVELAEAELTRRESAFSPEVREEYRSRYKGLQSGESSSINPLPSESNQQASPNSMNGEIMDPAAHEELMRRRNRQR